MNNNYSNQPVSRPPALALTTRRGLLKWILLNIITLGIYSLYFMYSIKRDLNIIADNHNGSRTMGLIALCLLTVITFGIATIVWWHKISARIGREQVYRGLEKTFGASTFWLWQVLGAMIIIGPFVYIYKLCKAMNAICADYNVRG